MEGNIEEVDADIGDEGLLERVGAIDVAKASAKVCVRIPGAKRRITRVWDVAATTNAIMALADELAELRIERVVLEATSDYWRPYFYILEARGLCVWLVNARDVKNVPGRPKTDKLDSIWLAKLNERGMLRRSFVPPREIRELRDYTRLRAELVEERSRYKNRLEKLLEDALFSALLGRGFQPIVSLTFDRTRNPRPLIASHDTGGRADSSSRCGRAEDGKRSESSRSTHSWPILAERQMVFGSVTVTAKQKTRAPSLPSRWPRYPVNCATVRPRPATHRQSASRTCSPGSTAVEGSS